MIDFTEINVKSLSDYDEIYNTLPKNLVDEQIIDELKKYVGLRCKTIIVEYPYYDKDYLSTYYKHYSKKFKQYDKKCARLHFEGIDEYYGFVTLRPTLENTKFGKTYLNPELLLDEETYLMLGREKAHVFGQVFEISSFPWKRQQTDITCCAHTAVWTIIRYFCNKHNGYPDATIGEIAEKVKNDWGRKTPTKGLSPTQVSDLFKEYGFSPLVIDNNKSGDKTLLSSFHEEIFSYVESGLPMVGFITPQKHAVSIMGHGKVNYDLLNDEGFIGKFIDKEANVISHTHLIESLYVMDDRYFPYREVTRSLPDKDSDVKYGINQFSYAVVPLYPRMQLTYNDVYQRMVQWLSGHVMDWEKRNVCRIYITSSNSLKREAYESDSMPEIVRNVIIKLSLPKFVWCIDLAGIENYKKEMTSGRIIVDATSATIDKEPWIIRHDGKKIQYKDYDDDPNYIFTVKDDISPYKFYVNNLE